MITAICVLLTVLGFISITLAILFSIAFILVALQDSRED